MIDEQERESLTIWGKTLSAQMRQYSKIVDWETYETGNPYPVMMLHIMEGAKRGPENGHPVEVPLNDILKLGDLLNEWYEREGQKY